MNQYEQNQQEPMVTLNVKVSWLNVIIGGLDELPHKFSRPVIDDISKQAQAQLQQQVPQGPLSDKIIR